MVKKPQMFTQQLRPQDRVAIVAYAGSAGLVLPSTLGTEKETIVKAIENLHAGGSTAGAQGLELAHKIAMSKWIRKEATA